MENKCAMCGQVFKESELYCTFNDTSRVYTNDIFYCAECFKKKYPNWSSLDIKQPQPYKDFLRENLAYFFPNWRDNEHCKHN
jgi:hypothetical protein